MNTMRRSPWVDFQGRTREVTRLCERAGHAARHRRQARTAHFEQLRQSVSIHSVTCSEPVSS